MNSINSNPSSRENFSPIFSNCAQKLQAIGYGSLAIISGIGIYAFFTTACFFGAGFILGQFYGPHGGLSAVATLLGHASFSALILGGFLSYYPIKHVGEFFFERARDLWNSPSQITK